MFTSLVPADTYWVFSVKVIGKAVCSCLLQREVPFPSHENFNLPFHSFKWTKGVKFRSLQHTDDTIEYTCDSETSALRETETPYRVYFVP